MSVHMGALGLDIVPARRGLIHLGDQLVEDLQANVVVRGAWLLQEVP
jgi:hypothetical protein